MITAFTIVLDGMPYIPVIWSNLIRLRIPWQWIVVEGYAEPKGCTSWCKPMDPRVSTDGTHEFLKEISTCDARVRHLSATRWEGKVTMCNEALNQINKPCLLMQMDSDELWLPHQIEAIHRAFQQNPYRHWAKFWCKYMVGPALYINSRDTYGNNSSYEWLRAWRYKPGMRFLKHEPPVLSGMEGLNGFSNDETQAMGCVFLHPAYALEKQVAFKEKYYGYENAVDHWKRLQQNMDFPVLLRNYFPWVKDGATVEKQFGHLL